LFLQKEKSEWFAKVEWKKYAFWSFWQYFGPVCSYGPYRKCGYVVENDDKNVQALDSDGKPGVYWRNIRGH